MSKKLTAKEIYKIKHDYFKKYQPYCMVYYSQFNYDILTKNIRHPRKAGRGSNVTYNDVIIMADTETSKEKPNTYRYEDTTIIDKNGNTSVIKVKKYNAVENYVVAWTISIRAYNYNIVTLYGHAPDEFCECLQNILNSLKGDETYVYFHNLQYDYVFLRKYLYKYFGTPERQLNTKAHNPICLQWKDCGLVLKDSLILAQRKLEKWADDLNVKHKKAVGKWDYGLKREQKGTFFTSDELTYIENDTLAGVECIDKTMQTLKKHIYSMPYTATGIPREECRKIAKANRGRESFLSMVLNYEQYIMAERVYHGGYTHANRFIIDKLILGAIICRDFSSSYPFCMLSEKYPMESFESIEDVTVDEILEESDDYAFMFKLTINNVSLINPFETMPSLQFSKCVKVLNPVLDNGRILSCDYAEIYLNEIDLGIIKKQYKGDYSISNVIVAEKDYLPRWFTDYVYKLYSDKCTLKDGDPVLYSIAKAKLNSLYGMCVQKALKDNLVENFMSGEYNKEPVLDKDGEPLTDEQLYQRYIDNNNSFLPYQWGVYITSYAMRNLFELSNCTVDENGEKHFVYSDTDSIYSTYWNNKKVDEYNKRCLEKLQANGYDSVIYNGSTYTLGVAEIDGVYSEFKTLGAKRYCCRYAKHEANKEKNWNKLKITVAGVPKSGVTCLNDDINNFTTGFIFRGEDTGKLTHHYIFKDEIEIKNNNSYGDSIDLTPCDYLLSATDVPKLEDYFTYEEIEVQVYE